MGTIFIIIMIWVCWAGVLIVHHKTNLMYKFMQLTTKSMEITNKRLDELEKGEEMAKKKTEFLGVPIVSEEVFPNPDGSYPSEKPKTEVEEIAKILGKPKELTIKDGLLELTRTTGKLGSDVWENTQAIIDINQRIDRLVDAIDTYKRVKGI